MNHLVVEWLQESAEIAFRGAVFAEEAGSEEILNELSERLHGKEGGLGWAETAKELKTKAAKGNTSVEHLDPDAPIRERRKHNLAQVNIDSDQQLMKYVFRLLRMGLKEEAAELCRLQEQHWRAATLNGWILYNDPRVAVGGDLEGEGPTGNRHRAAWKENAFAMSADTEAFGEFERAVYATLSGNFEQMASVCRGSWEDMLWAYYTVMIDAKVDAALDAAHVAEASNPLIMARRHYTEPDARLRNVVGKSLTPEEILTDKLKETDELQAGANEPLHIIQSAIILGKVDLMVAEMKRILDELKREEGFRYAECLRIFAEIVIALDDLNDITEEELAGDAGEIVHEYVRDLIIMETDEGREGAGREQRTTPIVAFYCSVLDHFLVGYAVERYADFLKLVSSPEERKQCFIWAKEYGLDTAEISKRVVELTRGMYDELELDEDENLEEDEDVANESYKSTSSSGGGGTVGSDQSLVLGTTTTVSSKSTISNDALDQEKIDSIELLLYEDGQRSEALKQSNFVMRTFMREEKRGAVRQVLEKIPEDSQDLIERDWGLVQAGGLLELPSAQNNIIREFDSIKLWCEALESHEEWLAWFIERKPSPLDESGGGPAVAVGRSGVTRQHEQQQYNDKLKRWQERLDRIFVTSRAKLLEVLDFDEGWLMDEEAEEEEDAEATAVVDRNDVREELRMRYIPDICEALHQILHEHELYKDCLEIADRIACPHNGVHLFDVYTDPDNTGRLKDLLAKIAASAKAIIEKDPNADTLGY
jgi:hypothetical protein